MRIDLEQAESFFAALPRERQIASLHPRYVIADAARDERLEACFHGFAEGGRCWMHAVHRSALPGVGGFDAQSPYGYGGPLSNSDDPEFLARAWAVYRDWQRQSGCVAEFVRFHPLLNNELWYGGTVRDDRATVWIDLALVDLLGSYAGRARTAIRKAQKCDVEFAWIKTDRACIEKFSRFYREAMLALNASVFYHFPDAYFEQLMGLPAYRLAVCRRGPEWLAAGLFGFAGDSVEYHLAATSAEGKRLAVNSLMLHEVALAARACGLRRFHLGGGSDADPANPLLFFKRGFSTASATFRTGAAIFDAHRYEALKTRWPERWARFSSRVLFYRFEETS